MKSLNEVYHKLEWWKFSDYVWEQNDEKGLFIKPAPNSTYVKYNPWEVNDKLVSKKYGPIPIYAKLLDDCMQLSMDYQELRIDLNFPFKKRQFSIDEIKTKERNYATIRQRLKEKIYEFVKEYGLLGSFWNKANRVINNSVIIPIIKEKPKFANIKNNFSLSFEKLNEVDEIMEFTWSDVENNHKDSYQFMTNYNYFMDNKKVPEGFYVDGSYVGYFCDEFVDSTWQTTLKKTNLTTIGLTALKSMSDKEIKNIILSGKQLIGEDFYHEESIPGMYYNYPIRFNDRSRLITSTINKKRLSSFIYNSDRREICEPLSTGSSYFNSHGFGFPYKYYLTNLNRSLVLNPEVIAKHYGESIDDFIEFIEAMHIATIYEENKKQTATMLKSENIKTKAKLFIEITSSETKFIIGIIENNRPPKIKDIGNMHDLGGDVLEDEIVKLMKTKYKIETTINTSKQLLREMFSSSISIDMGSVPIKGKELDKETPKETAVDAIELFDDISSLKTLSSLITKMKEAIPNDTSFDFTYTSITYEGKLYNGSICNFFSFGINKIDKNKKIDIYENFTKTNNRSLDMYQMRNKILSDYSNKSNPYSFYSPSLCGILSNILLWDCIAGKNMKICPNTKCNRFYFQYKPTKKHCSDACRQKTARDRDKKIKKIHEHSDQSIKKRLEVETAKIKKIVDLGKTK